MAQPVNYGQFINLAGATRRARPSRLWAERRRGDRRRGGPHDLAPTSPGTVDGRQTRALFRNANTTLLLSLSMSVLTSALVWHGGAAGLAVGWMLAMLVIAVLRYRLAARFRRVHASLDSLPRWRRLFVLGSAVNGTAWGLMGAHLALHATLLHPGYVAAALVIMAAVAVPLLCAVLAAYLAFAIPLLLPATLCFLLALPAPGAETSVALGAMMLVCLVALPCAALFARDALVASFALSDSEQRLREVLGGSLQGVLVHRDGEIVFANAALAAMCGYDSALAMHGLALERVLETRGGKEGGLVRLVRADGRSVAARSQQSTVRWRGGAATQLALVDVTEVESLREANRELQSFGYSVAHDLRSPLRAVSGFCNILKEDLGPDLGPGQREHIERICRASARMDRTIEDVLQLSRCANGELERVPNDLSAIATAIADELSAADASRRVTFAIRAGLSADADPGLLRVVIGNLLDNAWKFTRNEAEARIEVGTERRDDETVFYVRDNGVGFEMAYADKLFLAFERLHNDFPGTGIGLATVARIVQRHAGRVWASGAPGTGATFYFTLGPTGQ